MGESLTNVESHYDQLTNSFNALLLFNRCDKNVVFDVTFCSTNKRKLDDQTERKYKQVSNVFFDRMVHIENMLSCYLDMNQLI